jgi:Hint domain
MGILTYNPSPYNVDNGLDFIWIDSIRNNFTNLTSYTLLINGNSFSGTVVSSSQLNFGVINVSFRGSFEASVRTNNGSYTQVQTVNITCFVKGTKITCKNGIKLIEDCNVGDLVLTYKHGYKKIKNILRYTHKNNPNNSFHQICNVNGLTITGGHSILVDGLTDLQKAETMKIWGELKMIDDKYLLLASLQSEKIHNNEKYELFHIVLENDDEFGQYGIYADDVLTESMSIHCYNNCGGIKIV